MKIQQRVFLPFLLLCLSVFLSPYGSHLSGGGLSDINNRLWKNRRREGGGRLLSSWGTGSLEGWCPSWQNKEKVRQRERERVRMRGTDGETEREGEKANLEQGKLTGRASHIWAMSFRTKTWWSLINWPISAAGRKTKSQEEREREGKTEKRRGKGRWSARQRTLRPSQVCVRWFSSETN